MVDLGYLVLGPDYFFGDAVPNHEPGRDLEAWIMGSRKPAIDAFPAWLDAVKTKYGTSIVPASQCVEIYLWYRERGNEVLCCRYVSINDIKRYSLKAL